MVSRAQALSPADWWHEEDHALTLPVDDSMIHVRPGWTLPIHPLIGCLATAPRRETILSRHEGAYGGNLDCPEITATPVPRPVSMGSPRIRTGTHLTTIVSGPSLADACRQAVRQLKLWLEDEWRLTPGDAAILLGIAGHCRVCQISNALHTATCTVEVALLPPDRPAAPK